jgi:hypothetical protein
MLEFDPGPPAAFAELFERAPDYAPFRDDFWFDWGPIFYRGRLDGSARVLCIGSDPGPTERVACRTLVGDAGQRVQGFLSKLGLTRSYLCLNVFSFALFPGHAWDAQDIMGTDDQLQWRNELYDLAKGPDLQAIVAFGLNAKNAVSLWPGKGDLPLFEVPHPSSHDETVLVDRWRDAITELRAVVTPDPDGDPTIPNYGPTFEEPDYAPIPRRDLPFGFPAWFADDAWGRTAPRRHMNSVSRPSPDDRHTLIWIAPDTSGT